MADIPMNYRPLFKTGRRPARGARRVGPADPQETLSVSIRVRRRQGAPALPDPQQTGPSSLQPGPALSREQFANTYGADPADLMKVAQFARSNDLRIVDSSIPRRTVVVAGTVAQLSHAFAVDLDKYESPNGPYRGREGSVQVPSDLMDIVEGVFGLDNRRMARSFSVLGPAQATTPLTPPEVATLYDFPALPPTAAGQTIGLLEFGGGFIPSDIQAYFRGLNLNMPNISVVGVDGATNSPGNAANPNNADTEVDLDICVAGSVAPGANIAVYFAPWTEQGWVDAVTTAVHDTANHPSVISISWGWAEDEGVQGLTWSQAAIDAVSSSFQEASLLGITVLVASGDDGSNAQIGDGKAHVIYPGSDPWITCCGGTTMSNVSGKTFLEDTWNDNGATGGGISVIFPPPYWQNWAGIPHSANPGAPVGRGIPDVAGNADPDSGYQLVLYGSPYGPVGGTSAVCPLYAGLVALLNANLGEPVGYLNYNLYAFAGTDVYRDINDGQSNATNGAPGYKSGPGWDACTGFGSMDGTALMYALEGVGLPVALAQFNGKLFATWKGEERDDRIFYTTFNGTAWTPQQQVPGVATSSGAALAVLGNTLYAAWKGEQDDQRIWYTTFNGTSWAPQQIVAGVGTSTGPRLAVLGNALYMAWKGIEGDQRIFWSKFNGTSWTAQAQIPGTATSIGPSLVVYNNVLYALWKGIYGDPGIWYSSFNGTSWAAQKQVPSVATSEGPSVATFGNLLYAVWKGEYKDQGLWCSTFNGSSWSAQMQIPGVGSSVGPGLATFGADLYAAWKGEGGDQRIWYSNFNGTTWASQASIPGVGTSPDLSIPAQSTQGQTKEKESKTGQKVSQKA
jgi:Pro-kumamolisin, activation domain